MRGKDLSPYRRGTTEDDLQVLVAPELCGMASKIRIYSTGRVIRKLAAALGDDRGGGAGCSVR